MKPGIFRKKRIVSTLLALCMVLTLLPGMARAEDTQTAPPPAITYEQNGNTNYFVEDTTNEDIAGTALFDPFNGQILMEYEPAFKVYDSLEDGAEIETILCEITCEVNEETGSYEGIRIKFTFSEKPGAAENRYYVTTVSKAGVESTTRAEFIVYVNDTTGSNPEPDPPAAPEITAAGTQDGIIVVTLTNATFDAVEGTKTSNWFVGTNLRYEISAVELNSDRTTATLTLARPVLGDWAQVSVAKAAITGFDGEMEALAV